MMPQPRILQRPRAQAGETLVEALVAVLISSLSVLMLATAMGVTFRLVSQSKQALDDYYQAIDALQAQDAALLPEGVTSKDAALSLEDTGGNSALLPDASGSSTRTVTCYEMPGTGGTESIVSYEEARP